MSFQDEYRSLHHSAGIVDRSARGRILVEGADRRTYLQGLLSNDIAALVTGAGCYSTYLTAQGRMIADMRVFETGTQLLVDLDGSLAGPVSARWAQFVFSEDVKITNVSESTLEIGVYGPSAASVVAAVFANQGAGDSAELEQTLRSVPLYGNRVWGFSGSSAYVLASDDAGVPGFDIVMPQAHRNDLLALLSGTGAVPVSAEVVEASRIEAGRPVFGVDMNEDTIPLEAGIEDRAISLTKGCYVGQEVIIRVLHRGQGRVARKLVGITFDAESIPAPGDRIVSSGRDVGAVTSAVQSLALGRPIALGYVHRDFVQPGTAVEVNEARGTIAALPFVVSPVGRDLQTGS